MSKLFRLAAKILKKLFGQGFYEATDAFGHRLEAWLAAAANGFPARSLNVIGVTGTNGKTTTANFVTTILEAAGYKVGMNTTANVQIGEKQWANDQNMTVTSPWHLQKLLKQMKQAEVDWVVLEVTSHALYQGRVSGIPFQVGVLTNLVPDHADYHGSKTAEQYAASKAKLIQKARRTVVLNQASEWYDYFSEKAGRTPQVTFGTTESDIRAVELELAERGTDVQFGYGQELVETTLRLPGSFNVENALAAAGVALALEVEPELVQEGLANLAGVDGRMEYIEAGQDFAVVVDYAHTPDAFEKLFANVRQLTEGKLIAVFGGAPTHDYKGLGRVVGEMVNVAIICDDEPMEKNPDEIRQAIIEAAETAGQAEVREIADRREAIKAAFELAEPGDMVLILCLGHQQYRRVGGERIPWDDRQIARELLS